jgi:hypothetical protein
MNRDAARRTHHYLRRLVRQEHEADGQPALACGAVLAVDRYQSSPLIASNRSATIDRNGRRRASDTMASCLSNSGLTEVAA